MPLPTQPGNRAAAQLLRGPAQPLPPHIRDIMQARLGEPLDDVRVHTGAEASAVADDIDAVAFTTGADIVLGADAGALGTQVSDRALQHELVHVAQQRHAAAIVSGISSPTDAAERGADTLAHENAGLATTAAPAAGGGNAVPAVQRQAKHEAERAATRADVEAALTAFLQRVLQDQGGQTLRVTDTVKTQVEYLFADDPVGEGSIEAWLNQTVHPSTPAEFAHEVARQLPDVIPADRLDRLRRATGRDIPGPANRSAGQAIGATVVDSSVGPVIRKLPVSKSVQDKILDGARSAVAAGVVAGLDQAMDAGNLDAKAKASIHGIVEGLIKQKPGKAMDRQQEGAGSPYRQTPPPSTAPPIPKAPGEHLFNLPAIPWDFPGTKPVPKRTPTPEGPDPAVLAAAATLDPAALTPADARGTDRAGDFADARDFATDVGRRLELAQKAKNYGITVELGAGYAQVRDRAAIYAKARDIVYAIRDALPSHAADVVQVTFTVNGRPAFGFRLHPSVDEEQTNAQGR